MIESSALPALRVVLTDVNERVVEAWRAAFADTPGIEIRRGSILDQDVDAWVTPTNSRGRMDGGADAVIKRPRIRASTCVCSGRFAIGSPGPCRWAAPSACRRGRPCPGS
ncbi:hypothetical protein SAVIM40S_01978 [Streptomyces avidinii]